MSRSALKVLLLLLLTAAGWAAIWLYEVRTTSASRRTAGAFDAEQRNERLRALAARLDVPERVARAVVTDQQTLAGGAQRTTLLWFEYARDHSSLLPARRLVVEGQGAQVSAQVIKFEGDYAQERPPLLGRSLMLFRSVYSPGGKGAAAVDVPGLAPDFYKPADPRLAEDERPVWQDFWKLSNDATYQLARGVRVLEPHAVVPDGLQSGYVYTFTLDASGTLSVHREQIDPHLIQALHDGAKPRG